MVMGTEKVTRMPFAQMLAYLAFLVAGLMESLFNWTNLFFAGSSPQELSFMLALLGIPPLAIAGSLLALRYRDPLLGVLAVGFAIVVVFQFVIFRFSLWATEPPPRGLFELITGFDMAWGVLCVIAMPLRSIGVSWRLSVLLLLGLAAAGFGLYSARDVKWRPIYSECGAPKCGVQEERAIPASA
jgi:hypothetical protein